MKRFVLSFLTGFIALTAIGGGVSMLIGVDAFPLAWLAGTPFRDYTIPALILALLVGGSNLSALILLIGNHEHSTIVASSAGVVLAIYILTEVLILNQDPPGPTGIEIFYLALGVTVAGMGWYMRLANKK